MSEKRDYDAMLRDWQSLARRYVALNDQLRAALVANLILREECDALRAWRI